MIALNGPNIDACLKIQLEMRNYDLVNYQSKLKVKNYVSGGLLGMFFALCVRLRPTDIFSPSTDIITTTH